MSTNLDAGFRDFLATLRTTPAETAGAAAHRASIETKLRQSFGMTAFFRTGSFGNGTNVAGYSDVDYFAVIPTSRLKQNSSASLSAVADALRERFPFTENIRVDSPGVRVPFGLDGAEACEIVPVDQTGRTTLGFRQFDIPDGNGGWKFSAPESHNDYVAGIDARLDGRVKQLIRLVKAWKFMRNVPISSFYLELRVAHYAHGEKVIVLPIDLKRVLTMLQHDELSDVVDPRFRSGGTILRACRTDLQRSDALNKLRRAVQWAEQAMLANYFKRHREAFEWWDLVFNHNFPRYTGP